MRHCHWIITIVALALCLNAQADENRRDGNWWRAETEATRTVYVVGFFDGLELGHNFSFWATKTADGKMDMEAASKALTSFLEYKDKYLKNVKSGQLADGLTSFYEDFRNRSITISDAVWIVLNSIAGKPQTELDKMIENFRKSASTN